MLQSRDFSKVTSSKVSLDGKTMAQEERKERKHSRSKSHRARIVDFVETKRQDQEYKEATHE